MSAKALSIEPTGSLPRLHPGALGSRCNRRRSSFFYSYTDDFLRCTYCHFRSSVFFASPNVSLESPTVEPLPSLPSLTSISTFSLFPGKLHLLPKDRLSLC